jgi:hypothetical protein
MHGSASPPSKTPDWMMLFRNKNRYHTSPHYEGRPVTTSLAHHPHENRYCHNCGAAVEYHYCSVCGQETTLHVASASEFIHEFIGHYVAIEGRLWKTLVYLMLRPGFLTAEYIAGRRVRYVQPLRVYLTFSILFFFMLKMIGPPIVQPTAAERQAGVENAAQVRKQAISEYQIDPNGGLGNFVLIPGVGPKLQAFVEKPAKEQMQILASAFYSYVPYAMFCLMPLFALYLKLLYLGSGRRYGEHLLFALHSNGFAFAMFGLIILASYYDLGLIVFGLNVWLVLYLPKAMRRVYGGARWSTVLRWLVLMLLHMISIAAAIASTIGYAVLS